MTVSTSRVCARERDEHVAELLAEGLSDTEISAIVGVTERSVQRSKKRLGLAGPHPSPLSPEEVRLAESLLEDGASYGEVARTLNRHTSTIAARFRGMSQCSPREGFEMRMMMSALDDVHKMYRKAGHKH